MALLRGSPVESTECTLIVIDTLFFFGGGGPTFTVRGESSNREGETDDMERVCRQQERGENRFRSPNGRVSLV